jgi:hypothetical protein
MACIWFRQTYRLGSDNDPYADGVSIFVDGNLGLYENHKMKQLDGAFAQDQGNGAAESGSVAVIGGTKDWRL